MAFLSESRFFSMFFVFFGFSEAAKNEVHSMEVSVYQHDVWRFTGAEMAFGPLPHAFGPPSASVTCFER